MFKEVISHPVDIYQNISVVLDLQRFYVDFVWYPILSHSFPGVYESGLVRAYALAGWLGGGFDLFFLIVQPWYLYFLPFE